MKINKKFLLALATGLLSPLGLADDAGQRYLPESHAPSGVMADHLHTDGEWMFGYRYLREESRKLRHGSEAINMEDLGAAGFSMAPTGMTMEMHMLDIMVALSDDITLMFMPQYMTMDMTMTALATDAMDGMHGGHGAMPGTGSHNHEVSGVGDTMFAALFRVAPNAGFRLHAALGMSVPTGSVDEKNADGSYVHYGMQPGTGTWDLLPSLTYNDEREQLSWGAQLTARLPLEDKNKAGFSFGERYGATAWAAWRMTDWLSLSLRLMVEKEGNINGHYNGAHQHSSPPDFQANYGGEFLDYGLGVNMVAQQGTFAGIRLGLEWVGNLNGNYNGYQLGRSDGLMMTLGKAF